MEVKRKKRKSRKAVEFIEFRPVLVHKKTKENNTRNQGAKVLQYHRCQKYLGAQTVAVFVRSGFIIPHVQLFEVKEYPPDAGTATKITLLSRESAATSFFLGRRDPRRY